MVLLRGGPLSGSGRRSSFFISSLERRSRNANAGRSARHLGKSKSPAIASGPAASVLPDTTCVADDLEDEKPGDEEDEEQTWPEEGNALVGAAFDRSCCGSGWMLGGWLECPHGRRLSSAKAARSRIAVTRLCT
eukprot:GHVT01072093.1.p1 GENE.GHVT01072093.1~~GHVT01072093.1.p1  ORF type:complete len:134 (-),score=21.32 GHVT01072093.1:279-680(-)